MCHQFVSIRILLLRSGLIKVNQTILYLVTQLKCLAVLTSRHDNLVYPILTIIIKPTVRVIKEGSKYSTERGETAS